MSKFKSSLKMRGVFEQRIYRVVNGVSILEEVYTDDNLVVNLGKNKIVKLLANDGTNHYISAISAGTSSIEPTVEDTAIIDPFTKTLSGYSYPTQESVKFTYTIGTGDANGKAITEYGLITQDNTLFARKTRGAVNKESDVIIDGSWTLIVL